MSSLPTTSTRTRRSILTAAVGGAAAAAASVAASPLVATAANGDNAKIGKTNKGTASTIFQNSAGEGLRGVNQGSSGAGVVGKATSATGSVSGGSFSSDSTNGIGVVATANGGTNAAAFVGVSDAGTGLRTETQTGQGIFTSADSGFGIVATSHTGEAVHAGADSGTAIFGSSITGIGLDIDSGRVRFSSVSGVATISVGNTGNTVLPGVKVTSTSIVLLSPKSNVGTRAIWFTTNPGAHTFTIYMSSKRTSLTHIAWLLIG